MHVLSNEKEARSIEDAGCLAHYQTVLVRTSKSKNPYYGKNGEFTDTWSLDQVIFGWVVCVTAFLYVVSSVSWKVWLWATLPGRAAIWLAFAELAMQKIPEICAARYLFPGEPWHDRVQPLGGDREGQLRWLFRHARSTLVQRLLGGYYYPCHLTHTHTQVCRYLYATFQCVEVCRFRYEHQSCLD